jgi:hypothetical protein
MRRINNTIRKMRKKFECSFGMLTFLKISLNRRK